MAWSQPKTDWQLRRIGSDGRYPGDYFNAVDYNRIKNNIQELYNDAILAGYSVTITDMGNDKAIGDIFYATEINTIFDNLNAINAATYQFPYTLPTNYTAGGYIMTMADLNNAETLCLELYDKFNRGQKMLPFLLGVEGEF